MGEIVHASSADTPRPPPQSSPTVGGAGDARLVRGAFRGGVRGKGGGGLSRCWGRIDWWDLRSFTRLISISSVGTQGGVKGGQN